MVAQERGLDLVNNHRWTPNQSAVGLLSNEVASILSPTDAPEGHASPIVEFHQLVGHW
jgi:hypothetical protein